jgi:hypothetical protein
LLLQEYNKKRAVISMVEKRFISGKISLMRLCQQNKQSFC